MMEQDAADDGERQVKTLDPGTIVRRPSARNCVPQEKVVSVSRISRGSVTAAARLKAYADGGVDAAEEQVRVARVRAVDPGDLQSSAATGARAPPQSCAPRVRRRR